MPTVLIALVSLLSLEAKNTILVAAPTDGGTINEALPKDRPSSSNFLSFDYYLIAANADAATTDAATTDVVVADAVSTEVATTVGLTTNAATTDAATTDVSTTGAATTDAATTEAMTTTTLRTRRPWPSNHLLLII
ncbi:hypothetical protein ANCDUO_05159 [Ancylostoma duodenale]|uniref:Uncharacterized protein n=1 Tax=Ancylostoma duodenale TaxID=51022 RepID=A0A0C2GTC9_9BILA|nr:hypothetical protein ANCDUO_05159 [Ancylostoma duodenale]